MTEAQRELLRKARESLDAGRMLLDGGFAGFAASRAYYAMFYVAQAFLEGEGMAFSRHSAVIAAFGQHFARTGRAPVHFHRYLIEAMDARHEGDYGALQTISDEDATLHLTRGEEFLRTAEALLGASDEADRA